MLEEKIAVANVNKLKEEGAGWFVYPRPVGCLQAELQRGKTVLVNPTKLKEGGTG